jgi:hypothetical protein
VLSEDLTAEGRTRLSSPITRFYRIALPTIVGCFALLFLTVSVVSHDSDWLPAAAAALLGSAMLRFGYRHLREVAFDRNTLFVEHDGQLIELPLDLISEILLPSYRRRPPQVLVRLRTNTDIGNDISFVPFGFMTLEGSEPLADFLSLVPAPQIRER